LREFAGFVFPGIGVWQRGFALGDAGPAEFGELGVQGRHMLLAFRHIFFGKDGVGWTLGNAHRAVDALIGVDGQKIRTFAKTVDGTNIHTVGVFALDTGFGDNVRHDKLKVRNEKWRNSVCCAKPLILNGSQAALD
jgi:hypothetical protein